MSALKQVDDGRIYVPYPQRVSDDFDVVSIDHCYTKPWSTHPEASNARPACFLFMNAPSRLSRKEKSSYKREVEIDIETVDDGPIPNYNISNAKTMMSECGRHTSILQPEFTDLKDDWEEHIASIRTTWTVLQNRLFAKVMRVLHGDRLAHLTIQESKNEPIRRRLQIDKAAKRVKFAFANVNWDMTLILWLHNLFLYKLRGQLLTSYLEILQTLKLKIPSLVESLIEGTSLKPGSLSTDALTVLLKRTWDPVLSSISQHKPKRLPGQALLLVIANLPIVAATPLAAKRHKFWQHQLSFMGKVLNIGPSNSSTAVSVASYVQNMMASTRSKLVEIKNHFQGRPVVLVGFHIGSLIACQVAFQEQIQAIVCLGFPMMGIHGNRSEIDDCIYNCKTPTLFVVGQQASSTTLDDLEDMRERIGVTTGLVVVGGADDHLRMCRAQKKHMGVTQSVVDRCIIDEVTDFLGNTLQSALNLSDNLEDTEIGKKNPRKRKQVKQTLAVSSQTQDLRRQMSAKALKNLKKDPLLSSAQVKSESLNEGSPHLPTKAVKQTKTGKRGSPKKQAAKLHGVESAGKKSFGQGTTKTGSPKLAFGQSSLSSRSEAAAIASAPELSNLLQSMKTETDWPSSDPSTSSATSVASPGPESIPSSTQTSYSSPSTPSLAKFLLQSDILSKSKSNNKNLADSSQVSNDFQSASSVEGKMTHIGTQATTAPQRLDGVKKTEAQILIHTRDSSLPLSFPVSFSLASKVSTANPMIKVDSTRPINSTHPISSTHPINSTHPIKPILACDLQSRPPRPHLSGPVSQERLPSSAVLPRTSTSSVLLTKPVCSLVKASAPTPKSPLASVINMGSDTVQMKETPPTTTAPETVSIDLGQLSTSSNIVMKFGNSSKISLMPTFKPIPSPSSTTTSTTSLERKNMTLAAVLGEMRSTVSSSSLPATVLTKSQPTSTIPAVPPPTPPQMTPATATKPPDKNLTILSSSDLLSSLSSTAGLITLKLAPSSSSTSTSTPYAAAHGISLKDRKTEALFKTLSGMAVPKNVTAMTFNPSSSGNLTVVSKPVLSQHLSSSDHQLPGKVEKRIVTTGMPIVIGAASKANVTLASSSSSSSSPSSTQLTFQPVKIPIVSSSASSKTVPVPVEKSEHSNSSKILSLSVSQQANKTTTTTAEDTPSISNLAPTVNTTGDKNISTCSVPNPIIAQTDSEEPIAVSSPSSPALSVKSKSSSSSYVSATKQVLPTVASTRTRRIKTPKQYDL